MKRLGFAFIAFFVPLVLIGCGYTTRSVISAQYKTIYIPAFINKVDITRDSDSARKYKIYKPAIETDITRQVIDKFLFDGNLRPAKSENADLILRGELVEFRRDALRYNENEDVQEYRISLLVNISLWEARSGNSLWEEHNFTGDATYFTSGSLAKSEDTAINDAINDLARRIVERVVEQW